MPVEEEPTEEALEAPAALVMEALGLTLRPEDIPPGGEEGTTD